MSIGIHFEIAAPPVARSPNRTDIACFVGYVQRRVGAPLPATVLSDLTSAGWRDGPWRRTNAELESALQLPIAVDSWDLFDRLFAWEARPVRADSAATCATYLGAAVRSFFARGGRRAIIVRVGDPWPYMGEPDSRATLRRERIRAMIPAFADAGAPAGLFDPTDPRTWRGMQHLYGLPDVTLLLLPDLPDACAIDPLPPTTVIEPPLAPESFVECSAADLMIIEDRSLARLAAPYCDSNGYGAWRLGAAAIRDFLATHRRDCLFIGALPLPEPHVRRPSDTGSIYAETELLAFLRRVGAFEAAGVNETPTAGAASAFIQLAWPWLATRRSIDLPHALEPADGVLAGTIAAGALSRGTFRSVAGTALPEVITTTPVVAWGLPADNPAAQLAARVCVIAHEPDGWQLVSDVTTAVNVSWQPGGVSRIVASVLRAARRLGEELVFDTNGPQLWTRVRRAMEELLTDYWREGGLRGETSGEAFEVRCDRSTMTQNDMDNGRLICQIVLAPAAAIESIAVVLELQPNGVTTAALQGAA
jgi:hypothetical protein